MAKQTALDKAIKKLEGEIQVLQLAVVRLKEERQQKAATSRVRKPKAVPEKVPA